MVGIPNFGFRNLLYKWFQGELSVKKSKKLFERLKHDTLLREQFNRYSSIEATISGDDADQGLSHFELDRIENFVVESIVLEQAAYKKKEKKHVGLGWLKWAPIAAILLMGLIFLSNILIQKSSHVPAAGIPSELFAPRGGESLPRTHLFLFCVDDTEIGVRVHRLDRLPMMESGKDSCGLDSEFQFGISNQSTLYQYLNVFGLDAAGRRLWYFPKPGEAVSRPIKPDVFEQLLGESILLKVNHQAGDIRVFGVFSSRPVTDLELKKALNDPQGSFATGSLSMERSDIYVESFGVSLKAEGGIQ